MSSAQERAANQYPAAGTFGHDVPERSGDYAGYQHYEGEGAGPAALAAWLMIIGGLWSFFIGLAVVIKKVYFTSLPGYASASSNYAYHWNLSGWGWANLILGIVVAAVGVCVLLGLTWARVTGIVLAVISAVGTFLFLPFYPLWSIVVIAIDAFIIWALVSARRHQGA